MADRCNLVLLEGGRADVRESAWGGDRLDADLLWGLEHVRALASGWRAGVLIDEAWARGGAVVDVERRRLIWWGGRADLDVVERRVFAGILAAAWSGWEVTWAAEGQAAIAEAAGLPRSTVMCEWPAAVEELDVDGLGDQGTTLVTVRRPDGELRWAATEQGYLEVIRSREALLAAAAELPARAPGRIRPTGGVHVDLGARRLEAWWSRAMAELGPRLASMYPGWSTVWHGDRLEAQLEAAAGAVALATRTEDEILAGLREHLLEADTLAPDLGGLASWLGRFAEIVVDADVAGDRARQRPLPVAVREARLAEAIGRYRSG